MGKHATMPCGWGCGEQLTARTIRSHFTNCPRRDKPTYPDTAAAEARGLNEVNGLLNKWAEEGIPVCLTLRRSVEDFRSSQGRAFVKADGEWREVDSDGDVWPIDFDADGPLLRSLGISRETVLVPLEDEL